MMFFSKLIVSSFCLSFLMNANAEEYNYNPIKAKEYAVKYYNDNSTNSNNTGFTSFPITNENSGGNCTNFISQAILAGFSGETNKTKLWGKRTNFQADKDSNYGSESQYGFQWYIQNNGVERGKAWASADELYKYAKGNKSTYKGLHFRFITHDTAKNYMKYNDVRVGDIIFADWDANGKIDHSMIVTDFNRFRDGYNAIWVTYQTTNRLNKPLGELNEESNKVALFSVYRPINYTTHGN